MYVFTSRSIYFCHIGQYGHPAIPARLSSLRVRYLTFLPWPKTLVSPLTSGHPLPSRQGGVPPPHAWSSQWAVLALTTQPPDPRSTFNHFLPPSRHALPHPASWPWPWNPGEKKPRRKEERSSDTQITHWVPGTMLFVCVWLLLFGILFIYLFLLW